MIDSIRFSGGSPVRPSRPTLRLMISEPSPVDEVLDGLGSALGRWLRSKLRRVLRPT
jgi:hypothetical protein